MIPITNQHSSAFISNRVLTKNVPETNIDDYDCPDLENIDKELLTIYKNVPPVCERTLSAKSEFHLKQGSVFDNGQFQNRFCSESGAYLANFSGCTACHPSGPSDLKPQGLNEEEHDDPTADTPDIIEFQRTYF